MTWTLLSCTFPEKLTLKLRRRHLAYIDSYISILFIYLVFIEGLSQRSWESPSKWSPRPLEACNNNKAVGALLALKGKERRWKEETGRGKSLGRDELPASHLPTLIWHRNFTPTYLWESSWYLPVRAIPFQLTTN